MIRLIPSRNFRVIYANFIFMFIIKIKHVQGSVKILLREFFFLKIVYDKSDLNWQCSNSIYLQQLKEVLLSL